MRRENLQTWIAILISVGLVLLGGFFVMVSRPQPMTLELIPPAPTPTPPPPTVHVSGAVQNPDTIHSLAYGSRWQDAITAAGGVSLEADLSAINLAAPLHDGEKIYIPRLGEIIVAVDAAGQVYINRASAAELEALPDIGEVLAERIVAYRTDYGAFTSIEELQRVEGIGEALAQRLAPLLRFEP